MSDGGYLIRVGGGAVLPPYQSIAIFECDGLFGTWARGGVSPRSYGWLELVFPEHVGPHRIRSSVVDVPAANDA